MKKEARIFVWKEKTPKKKESKKTEWILLKIVDKRFYAKEKGQSADYSIKMWPGGFSHQRNASKERNKILKDSEEAKISKKEKK